MGKRLQGFQQLGERDKPTKNGHGNDRYNSDTLKLTIDGINRLKNDL